MKKILRYYMNLNERDSNKYLIHYLVTASLTIVLSILLLKDILVAREISIVIVGIVLSTYTLTVMVFSTWPTFRFIEPKYFWPVYARFYKRFIDSEVTHYFFYSKKQERKDYSLGYNWSTPWLPARNSLIYFKGMSYTEMKEIGHGWSNYCDVRLVGLGSLKDINVLKLTK
ncbi:hypothetical protein LCGC14_0245790 [marine sediment metagenome]|uniref:Uncharacterized protein n=1 Tax=marine sediment metagenome TaxID=412755 RepID=A0A0F9XAJ3_9ZZZZ